MSMTSMTSPTQRYSWARKTFLALASLTLVLSSTFAVAQQPNCSSDKYREFDFWLGEWEILNPNGDVVANSTISTRQSGCVLHENYSTVTGYTGESLNIYDASRDTWHQSWVDLGGALLLIEGGLENGNMVLGNQSTDDDGIVTHQRITWTPNADGTVRQHWQTKVGDGEWSDLFNGIYRKKA